MATKSAGAGAAYWLTHDGAVEILAQIDECEERIEQAGFHFVGQMQAAGGRARQSFTLHSYVGDDFQLALVRGPATDGFPAYVRAVPFDRGDIVMDTNPLGIEGGGD